MGLQWTLLAVPLLFGAGVQLVVALAVLSRRERYAHVPGSRVAAALLVAVSVMMLTYAVELAITGPDTAGVYDAKVLWNMAQYLGMAAVPGLWFCYTVRFTRYDGVPRAVWGLIVAGAVLTPVVVFTNSFHHQFWPSASLATDGPVPVLVNEHGVAFYAFVAYSYALVLAATSLLVRAYAGSVGLYRRQTLGLLVGSLAPFVASGVYLVGPTPLREFNLTAFGFAVTAAAVAWSVRRHRLLSLAPIARRTALEQMVDPAVVLDPDGRVLDSNPAASALFTTAPVGHCATRVAAVPFDTGGEDDSDEALVTVTDDGADRHFERTRTDLTDGQRVIGTLVVFRDVTDRVRRERELRRQNERLDQFASVVSHDLRNPLGAAEGYLDLYRETGQSVHYDSVVRAHDRMEAIVDDLLALARDGGDLGETEPVSVQTAAARAWESIDAEDVTLELGGETQVEADRGRILRLFENLFRNSIEHGQAVPPSHPATDGGAEPLTVSVGVRDDGRGFYVADDGVGLPEHLRENVFESGVTGSETGTGLGLAIVASIADSHGWAVYPGENEDDGARFDVITDTAG
ncbi:histidine kinase N-terminal 7TM domain-containing protein [Haloarchaeobius sp. DFWS5]|uniref:histidine kinase N-terminal 7TM domain-containing protein n=1 Tax=Haloarchaeobius sp. DFWS5 TaxID=3446114 RepID=UPI003EBA0F29